MSNTQAVRFKKDFLKGRVSTKNEKKLKIKPHAGLKIYLAGPLTTGDVAENIHDALYVGDTIAAAGFNVFIPHLNHFWALQYPNTAEYWLSYDFSWLKMCDVVVRIPGDSVGADLEVDFAKKNKIPVIYFEGDYQELFNELEKHELRLRNKKRR
jgi:nucleoside 2-deoxyribosyltransferase